MGSKILVVDDEHGIREALGVVLKDYQLTCVASGEEALQAMRDQKYSLVIQDLKLKGLGGVELLQALREQDEQVIVVVMTAFSSWDLAVQAMRAGAYDYIKKPFDNQAIRHTVARALALRHQQKGDLKPAWDLIGKSPAIQDIFSLVKRIGPSDSTIIIQGPSGSGKELIARAIHDNSLRNTAPYVAVNCGAFTETLLESEMFGHVKGAFTGAHTNKKGLVEVTDGGTFFMDEIGELPLSLQVKLLRLIENKEFIPVGDSHAKKVDIRFICATNRDLQEEVRLGNFREDLYYRLNVVAIDVPPLKNRREDIPLLIQHFLKVHQRPGSPSFQVDDDAADALSRFDWPGNVRELQNCIQRAVALCDGQSIRLADLEEKFRQHSSPSSDQSISIPEGGLDLMTQLEDIERRYIERALQMTDGNLTKAADLLGMTFRSMRYKAKKLGINR